VASDWHRAGLSPADSELCRFAEKLTATPQAMGRDDLGRLRRQGFDDAALHDAVQVISYFNYINRVADGLGVEPEDFIRPWEQSPDEPQGR